MKSQARLLAAIRFAVKHAAATAVTVVVIAGLLTIAYLALLVGAVIRGGGIGSPVVLPVTLVLVNPGLALAALVVFVPSTALTEWLFRKRAWPRIFQIPVVTAIAAVTILLEVTGIAWIQDASLERGARASRNIFIFLLFPLGIYWWSLQAADWLTRLTRRLWARAQSTIWI